MSNPAVRNLAVMLAAMSYIKNLDQEDPQVIMYVRLAYGAYLLLGLVLNLALYWIIVRRGDRRVISVPRRPASPFAPPPPEGEEEDEEQRQTVMEYDLGVLASARSALLTNAVILGLLHLKMQTLSPMIMSAVMGLTRLLDDPLVHLHLLRRPAVGKLRRPFQAEKNPIAAMLQQMAPPLPSGPQAPAQRRRPPAESRRPEEGEELAGSEEEEDDTPVIPAREPEGDEELEGEIDLTVDGESKKTR